MNFVSKRSTRPLVPIVSLIDILAILLIYFILTSAPKEDKAFASITLPKASSLAKKVESKSRIELALTADSKLILGSEDVPQNQLATRLKRLKKERPDLSLELKADERAPLKSLVAAWDALTRAGYPVKDVPARILIDKQKNSTQP
ncbi:MAG: biopolymer transporter ExbD [Verrucomicrobiota bacterium]|nr:biopolymer transporter ExbD [Verrucomicrobiales bacterium]MED5472051.1 biopolymer transporter ExbD [Verrucomicrobiota bacterium]